MRKILIVAAALAPGFCAIALAQGWQVFPPYPGSRELCHQRVHGSSGEITWTAYTASDLPQVVTAFYEGRLGKPETDSDGTRFRGAKEGATEQVLSVHPIGGSYPRCGKDPGPDDRTMLIVSRAVKR